MSPLRLILGAGAALALVLPAPLSAATAPKPTPARAAPDRQESLEPEALQALKRMSAYLGTLTTFEINSDTSLDLVLDDGQKLKLDGVTHYRVRRPDGFVIEVATDRKLREMVYDGKMLTVYAPRLGYYARVPAPPTIRQTLDAAYDKYGVAIPLEDLFRWSDPDQARFDQLKSAIVVGASTVDGVACDQYAFREADIDWQIWIQKGDQPVPRKVVITVRSDPDRPEFTAKLDWNTAPKLAADAFTFQPDKNALPIRMATAGR